MVDLVEVGDESFLDITATLRQRARNVVDEVGTVSVVHHLSEELARLLVVVVGVLMRIAARGALNGV